MIATIQIIQITFLIRSRLPCFAGLSLMRCTHSCRLPAGQKKAHHTRPKNMDSTSIAANTRKLPFMMCSEAAWRIRYGEKYQIVMGNSKNKTSSKVLLIFWLITSPPIIYQFDILCSIYAQMSSVFWAVRLEDEKSWSSGRRHKHHTAMQFS